MVGDISWGLHVFGPFCLLCFLVTTRWGILRHHVLLLWFLLHLQSMKPADAGINHWKRELKCNLSLSDCCCQTFVSTVRLLTNTITATCRSVDELQKQCQRQEGRPKPPNIRCFSEMRCSRVSHSKRWKVKGRGEEPMGTCLKCAGAALSWSS